jgi:hypothetical protein
MISVPGRSGVPERAGYNKWENFETVIQKALAQTQVKTFPIIFLTSGRWSKRQCALFFSLRVEIVKGWCFYTTSKRGLDEGGAVGYNIKLRHSVHYASKRGVDESGAVGESEQ